jgi:hypothetical protein
VRSELARGREFLKHRFLEVPRLDFEQQVFARIVAGVNLLVVRDIGLGVGEIAALGVRRISVGGALALAAWTGFIRAAQTLRSEGSFTGLASLVPYAEINGLFDSASDSAFAQSSTSSVADRRVSIRTTSAISPTKV